VKWTKTALVLAIPALALLLVGQSIRPPAAEAKPVDIITINWVLCVTLDTDLDWNGDGVVNAGDKTTALFACLSHLDDEAVFDNMIGAHRGLPVDEWNPLEDPPTPEDFTAVGRTLAGGDLTPMDSDAGQLHQEDGRMWVIAFVTNDEPVGFYADEGRFARTGRSNLFCGPGPVPNPDFDVTDEDCDDDGVKGDGVVAFRLDSTGASRGSAIIRVRQDNLEAEDQYTVVGEPYRIELTVNKTALQTGAPLCNLFKNTAAYLATLGAPQKSPLSSKVTDNDGTALTGAIVTYEIMSEEVPRPEAARLAQPLDTSGQSSLTPTLSSALGVVSPMVICGDEEPGAITLRATISKMANGVGFDSEARERHAEVELKVQGPPTEMVMSAAPAGLVCDGTATSAVSATLTDAAGNPALDGNVVRFDVKALGTFSPIEAKSAGGASTTTVTPLTDVARGVTVNATLLFPTLVEDDEGLTADDTSRCAQLTQVYPCPVKEEALAPNDLEKAFLLECSTGAPPPAAGPAPTGSGAPSISPPSTGDGGYLQ